MCIKEQKTAARVVASCSGMALIVAMVMIVKSILFVNEAVWDLRVDFGNPDEIKDRAFLVLMVFSILAIILGIAGTLVLCFKSRVYHVCLTLMLSVSWIVILVYGASLVLASTMGQSLVDQVCDLVKATQQESKDQQANVGKKTQLSDEAQREITEAIKFLDFSELDTYMCSRFCPCPDIDQIKDSWISLTREDLASYERIGQFVFNEPEPWVFGKYSYPIGSTVGQVDLDIYEKEFSTFRDCVLEGATRKIEPALRNEDFIATSKRFVEGGSYSYYLDALEFFEQRYDCSGSCKPNLFYATQDIALGLPEKTCV